MYKVELPVDTLASDPVPRYFVEGVLDHPNVASRVQLNSQIEAARLRLKVLDPSTVDYWIAHRQYLDLVLRKCAEFQYQVREAYLRCGRSFAQWRAPKNHGVFKAQMEGIVARLKIVNEYIEELGRCDSDILKQIGPSVRELIANDTEEKGGLGLNVPGIVPITAEQRVYLEASESRLLLESATKYIRESVGISQEVQQYYASDSSSDQEETMSTQQGGEGGLSSLSRPAKNYSLNQPTLEQEALSLSRAVLSHHKDVEESKKNATRGDSDSDETMLDDDGTVTSTTAKDVQNMDEFHYQINQGTPERGHGIQWISSGCEFEVGQRRSQSERFLDNEGEERCIHQ